MNTFLNLAYKYGGNPEFILWNEGNASIKTKDNIIISQTGSSLGHIPENGTPEERMKETFITMVRKDLEELLSSLTGSEERSEVVRKVAGARLNPISQKMPSSEALLHVAFPQTYVFHTHPTLVNAMTAAKDGKKHFQTLFGDRAVWIDFYANNYNMARATYIAQSEHKNKTGKAAEIVFLENHGLVVAADSLDEIDALTDFVMSIIEKAIGKLPEFTPIDVDTEVVTKLSPAMRMIFTRDKTYPASVAFTVNQELLDFINKPKVHKEFAHPFTEMQSLYTGGIPFVIDKDEDLQKAFDEYKNEYGEDPRVVLVKDIGMFALGDEYELAVSSRDFFLAAIRVYNLSQKFGGAEGRSEILPSPYKTNRPDRRMNGRVAIVTGGAQGFGEGISNGLASEGAYIVIADLNLDGAQETANKLNSTYGYGVATAVQVDVGNEESVKNMVSHAVLTYGGVDVLISNAGIAIAGDLTEMTQKNFELVTKVNYTGYFLCSKYASEPMKIQHQYKPDYWMDIIEINSKSGLVGSRNNFAYAGSKFGGVGLTQSFALELVQYNIKVNAICPGNLLDGPLWSDPEKGLFVQYLEAGKVAGAKTVADVRRHYEKQVPMNRGCELTDVVRAVLYIVEQKYETGQALPVSGGQVMLK